MIVRVAVRDEMDPFNVPTFEIDFPEAPIVGDFIDIHHLIDENQVTDETRRFAIDQVKVISRQWQKSSEGNSILRILCFQIHS
ncbi:hypothetical protein SAMN06296241_1363 [Salinimicrobium sediminis]|uniref:Uncharacterized protein n=1 Tax=Salinimicrobium sediminis TaxID=1343891 RepID=A0A285X4A2_9FLAO|nr:hypothetical protein [Salinimicrobium sediminis]SOC79826.1 hypothetical protein SAMN06296241_1363 [Salinimicrobium sediminis]